MRAVRNEAMAEKKGKISDMIDGFFKLVKMLWQCKLV